jgi:hypothetical protein
MMNKELEQDGWKYPESPEPILGTVIEYMHDGEVSQGIYMGKGLVDDKKHTDLFQEIDLWR